VNPICPRCHSRTLVRLSGGGCECLACSYAEGEELIIDDEVMSSPPGVPLPTRGERIMALRAQELHDIRSGSSKRGWRTRKARNNG